MRIQSERIVVLLSFNLAFLRLAAAVEIGTQGAAVGDEVLEWTTLPSADGRVFSPKNVDTSFVVLAFVADRCSLCRFQQTELNHIHEDYADLSVQVIAISVGKDHDRKPPRAKLVYRFPHLRDSEGRVARLTRITRTPTILVLNKERRIVYRGALNDDLTPIRRHYVRDALNELLNGQPVTVPETVPIGCGVLYE